MLRCRVVRQSHNGDRYYLLHATTAGKAKAINMTGFKIGPKTRRATGYCAKDDYDCQRAEAYRRSEETIEAVRRERYPEKVTRTNATFFYPYEGNFWVVEPGEVHEVGQDDYGRPIYNLGYGKSDLFVVDQRRIPCQCGVGDGTKSDAVFLKHGSEIDPRGYRLDVGDPDNRPPEELADRFWREAIVYDPETFDVYPEGYDGEKLWGEDSNPEVWCPCHIPRSAIVEWYGTHNPMP